MLDFGSEIQYQATRSGGKGGQNVNKVETAVIGSLQVSNSRLLTEDQKILVLEKLANRINAEGALMVKSQIHRTQLANKEEVTKRINELIRQALHRKKPRIATKIKRSAIEKRLESKKRHADLKAGRKKYRAGPAE